MDESIYVGLTRVRGEGLLSFDPKIFGSFNVILRPCHYMSARGTRYRGSLMARLLISMFWVMRASFNNEDVHDVATRVASDPLSARALMS